jgi:predicted porin
MNKNIKLAVAGAVLALSATADAGIIIPAGDWTLDIGGNVNTYYTSTRATGDAGIIGGRGGANSTGTKTANNITTGLLPAFLSVSGTTRQNDLDVSFTVSIQPGTADAVGGTLGSQNNRQAFLTFGDKSWGSFKLGKDLGIFASDAILSDMTLLGVGNGAGNFSVAGQAANNTTLGRIGTGYMYADWKSQVAYTTPNFSGFQATVGVTQAWNAHTSGNVTDESRNASGNLTAAVLSGFGGTARGGANSAVEAKASYSFAANDVTGKVWVSGFNQKVVGTVGSDNAWAADVGANVNVAGLGLTGYYYKGEGVGQTIMLRDGYNTAGQKRDSDGGYVQATYVLPTKTKLGVSWGESNLDLTGSDVTGLVKTNEQWTAGLYHPLTKHLNIVAEYSDVESKSHSSLKNQARTGSLGAILFF